MGTLPYLTPGHRACEARRCIRCTAVTRRRTVAVAMVPAAAQRLRSTGLYADCLPEGTLHDNASASNESRSRRQLRIAPRRLVAWRRCRGISRTKGHHLPLPTRRPRGRPPRHRWSAHCPRTCEQPQRRHLPGRGHRLLLRRAYPIGVHESSNRCEQLRHLWPCVCEHRKL